jgi:hypothetical protein
VATATAYTLHLLARRIQALTIEERQLQQQITAVLNTHAPQLLETSRRRPGQRRRAARHRRRQPRPHEQRSLLRRLCGVSPIEASSGKPPDAGSTAAASAAPTPPSAASP